MTDRAISDLRASLPDRILAEAYWGDTTLKDPAWRKAFDQVPRAAFAPATWYEWVDGRWATRWRGNDYDAWLHAVYAVDAPFITHLDDDDNPASSLSAPMLVAAMLGALRLEDGMTVLESGAGLGWTATLLAARLGAENVVSVECDFELFQAANVRARDAGFRPLIGHGDGELGWGLDRPFNNVPYDRVSATHAVTRIPPAWIEQTKPGGLVCAPLKVAERDLDLFVQLTVGEDGCASGRVLFPLAFMGSRTSPTAPRAASASGPSRESTTDLDLPAIVEAKEAWVLRLAVPGLDVTGPRVEAGDDVVWLGIPDGSWAVGYVPQGASWKGAVVEQHGPADVWTIAEDAWARWEAAGRPALDEYGLSVTADGVHTLWMQNPDNVVVTLP